MQVTAAKKSGMHLADCLWTYLPKRSLIEIQEILCSEIKAKFKFKK